MKDKPQFKGGMLSTSSASKRTKNTAGGEYTSSDGGTPQMDLNQTLYEDENSGTPMSTRRPIGNKAAKNKGKAKATSSQNPNPDPAPPSAASKSYDALVRGATQRMLLDTHAVLKQCQDPGEVEFYKNLIDDLKRQLGMN